MYFDPSFYTPSLTNYIIFVVIFAVLIVGTYIVGFVFMFLMQYERTLPAFVRNGTIVVHFALTVGYHTSLVVFFSKSLTCFVSDNDWTNNYCGEKAKTIMLVISAISLLLLLILSVFARYLNIDPSLKSKNILSSRRGVHIALMYFIADVNAVVITAFIHKFPLVMSVVHALVFLLLAF